MTGSKHYIASYEGARSLPRRARTRIRPHKHLANTSPWITGWVIYLGIHVKPPNGVEPGSYSSGFEDQIIMAVAVTQEANDVQQLLPILERMNQNLAAAGIAESPGIGLADAGYWSEANLLAGRSPDLPELLVATTKDWKQRKAARERGRPRGRIPKDLGLRERMERKLLTKRGLALYKKRGVLVEPVFGQMGVWPDEGRAGVPAV